MIINFPDGGKNVGDAANVVFTKLKLKQNLKNVRAIFLCRINIRPFCVSGVGDANLILTPTKADIHLHDMRSPELGVVGGRISHCPLASIQQK